MAMRAVMFRLLAGTPFAAGLVAACFVAAGSAASSAVDIPPPSEAPKANIESTTVEASRSHDAIERQIWTFVNAIAVKPGDESLARWQIQIPLCPLVAGIPGSDGEYIMSRISKIAAAAGAPLAPQNCKGNFFVVVTSDPEGSILNLFSESGKAPPGLTAWDESFLKAAYRTRSTDRAQMAAFKSAMVQDVAP
jgi:hypothetical protein